VSGDLIQIRADLLNEQIVLKDLVDIWIMPGVVINSGNSQTTIIAPTTGALNCRIYGQGKIKNDTNGNCIFINNPNANLTIECNVIEGTGGGSSSVSVNIQIANKFHLNCNYVYNRDFQAIRVGQLGAIGLITDLNLKILKVETGNITTSSPFTGTTAITSRGNGFIKINKVLCRNIGHCLSHREGIITAQIKKMTTKNNYTFSGMTGSTIHVNQYSGTPNSGSQKLILYFYEIQALAGIINSSAGIEVGEGTGIFIGRRVHSKNGPSIQIVGINTKGYVKCNEIISTGNGDNNPVNAIEFSLFTNQLTIDANYVQGYRDGGVIFINDANVQIKNAKLVNTYTGTGVSSLGLFIAGTKVITLKNVEIVTGELTNGRTIYHTGSTEPETFDLKNYGLFVNKAIDSNLKLLIGTGLSDPNYNYQYIVDSSLI
ncbi:MAG: hypothetical protein LH629_01320, partial [Ignavibacteria bacterium]|nr:hypothetical protein [Ignavibacteria bacterium]